MCEGGCYGSRSHAYEDREGGDMCVRGAATVPACLRARLCALVSGGGEGECMCVCVCVYACSAHVHVLRGVGGGGEGE